MVMLMGMALFLAFRLEVVPVFLGPWFWVFRLGAGGWTATVGVGIGGAEGRGWITVVVVVAQQQHLQKQ
jgi:hypothetical protein